MNLIVGNDRNENVKNFYFLKRSCRREIISKYFSEVWNDSKCNKMCDRCYHIDCVKIPKIEITNHILDLYAIIENAEAIDVKLTGTKLIDAWYVLLWTGTIN